MKRLAIIILSMLVLFSSAACSQADHVSETTESSSINKTVITTEHDKPESIEETTSSESQKQAILDAVSVLIDRDILYNEEFSRRYNFIIQIIRKGHALGMAVVGVDAVHAVGRHLIQPVPCHDRQRAVLQAEIVRPVIAEHLTQLFGLGVGADVPVVRLQPEQRVAHTAADSISRKAALPQGVDDLICFGSYLNFHGITFFS